MEFEDALNAQFSAEIWPLYSRLLHFRMFSLRMSKPLASIYNYSLIPFLKAG